MPDHLVGPWVPANDRHEECRFSGVIVGSAGGADIALAVAVDDWIDMVGAPD